MRKSTTEVRTQQLLPHAMLSAMAIFEGVTLNEDLMNEALFV
jgi:hypothetical protein